MYLTSLEFIVSAVVLRVSKQGVQFPIYYDSKSMLPAELKYTLIEKISFTLGMAMKKLHLYFQMHEGNIITSLSLRALFHKPDLFRPMVKWPLS